MALTESLTRFYYKKMVTDVYTVCTNLSTSKQTWVMYCTYNAYSTYEFKGP